jgi:hypothetical protein
LCEKGWSPARPNTAELGAAEYLEAEVFFGVAERVLGAHRSWAAAVSRVPTPVRVGVGLGERVVALVEERTSETLFINRLLAKGNG